MIFVLTFLIYFPENAEDFSNVKYDLYMTVQLTMTRLIKIIIAKQYAYRYQEWGDGGGMKDKAAKLLKLHLGYLMGLIRFNLNLFIIIVFSWTLKQLVYSCYLFTLRNNMVYWCIIVCVY